MSTTAAAAFMCSGLVQALCAATTARISPNQHSRLVLHDEGGGFFASHTEAGFKNRLSHEANLPRAATRVTAVMAVSNRGENYHDNWEQSTRCARGGVELSSVEPMVVSRHNNLRDFYDTDWQSSSIPTVRCRYALVALWLESTVHIMLGTLPPKQT